MRGFVISLGLGASGWDPSMGMDPEWGMVGEYCALPKM